jgi:streptogramin lyase
MLGGTSKIALAGAVLIATLALAPSALAEPKVDGIFPLKSEIGQNNKLVTGPDGNIWLTLSSAEADFAKLTPSGDVEELEVDDVAFPKGIAVGPEGRLWVTQNERLVSFEPEEPNDTHEKFDLAAIKGESSIVAGPDGNLWVAGDGAVLRVDPDDAANPTEFKIAGLSPRDIDVAGGSIVVADTGVNRIVTLTTAGAQVDYSVGAKVQGLAGSPDGLIGFSQPDSKEVGLLAPQGTPQLFPQGEDPFGVAYGPDGAFWIVRAVGGGLTRLSATGQLSLLNGLPATSNVSARQIAAGPNNTLWVTLVNPANPGAVARVSGVELPPLPSPNPPGVVTVKAGPAVPDTRLENGPKAVVRTARKRAVVKFRFSSNLPGSRFQCALTRLRKGRKPAPPRFGRCSSPRTYARGAGRYRFEVAAVRDGLADGTPARRTFRIVRLRHSG